jgi:hypothetical protein
VSWVYRRPPRPTQKRRFVPSLVGGPVEYNRTATDPVGITDATSTVLDIARVVTDPVGVTDVVTPVKAIAVTITDDVGVTEVVSPVKSITPTVTDDVGITDVTSRVHDAVRTVTDLVDILDTTTKAEDNAETTIDPVGITDITSRVHDAVRTITDPVGVTDLTSPVKAIAPTITDPVGITDNTNRVHDAARPVTNDVGITDVITPAKAIVVTITDPVGITEVNTSELSIQVLITDPVGVTDVVAKVSAIARTITAAIGINDGRGYLDLPGDVDAYAQQNTVANYAITNDFEGYARIALSTLTPTAGNFFNHRSGASGVSFALLSDGTLGMGWHDVGQGNVAVQSSVTVASVGVEPGTPVFYKFEFDVNDGAGGHAVTFKYSTTFTNDPASAVWNQLGSVVNAGAFVAAITDPTIGVKMGAFSDQSDLYFVQLNDGIGGTPQLIADFTDLTGLEVTAQEFIEDSSNRSTVTLEQFGTPWTYRRTIIYQLSMARTITDPVGITDVVAPAKTTAVTITDDVGITDATSRVHDAVRVVTDLVDILDTVSEAEDNAETTIDPVGITDIVNRVWDAARTVTDPVGVTDNVTSELSIQATATDPVGITDVTTPVKAIAVTITDDVGVTDPVSLVVDYARTVTDAVGVTEVLDVDHQTGGPITRTATDPVGITEVVATARVIARTIEGDPAVDIEAVGYAVGETSFGASVVVDTDNLSAGTIQEGDLMVAFHGVSANRDSIETTAGGWTLAKYNAYTNGTSALWYKIATASEADPTFSTTVGGNHEMAAIVAVFRNVRASVVFDITHDWTAGNHFQTITDDFTPPNQSITTVTNGAFIIVLHHGRNGIQTGAAAPSGMTLFGSVSGTNRNVHLAYVKDVVAGFYQPADWAHTGPSGQDGAVWTLAVRPDAGGVTITDSVTTQITTEHTVTITDSVGLTDTTTRVHDAARELVDFVALRDQTFPVLQDLDQTVTENVGITDNVIVTVSCPIGGLGVERVGVFRVGVDAECITPFVGTFNLTGNAYVAVVGVVVEVGAPGHDSIATVKSGVSGVKVLSGVGGSKASAATGSVIVQDNAGETRPIKG